MADTVLYVRDPKTSGLLPIKAIDNLDGTYSLTDAAGGDASQTTLLAVQSAVGAQTDTFQTNIATNKSMLAYIKGLINDIFSINVDQGLGSDSATGVFRDPVKTVEEATAICIAQKTREISLHGNYTYTLQANLTRPYVFEGDSRNFTILATGGFNLAQSTFKDLQLTGVNGDGLDIELRKCTIGTATINGHIYESKIDGNVTVLAGKTLIGSDIKFGDSSVLTASDVANPVTIKIRDCTGAVTIAGVTNTTDTIIFRCKSGKVTIDSTVTAADTVQVYGTFDRKNNSAVTILTNYKHYHWTPGAPTNAACGTITGMSATSQNNTPNFSAIQMSAGIGTIAAADLTSQVFSILRMAMRLEVTTTSFHSATSLTFTVFVSETNTEHTNASVPDAAYQLGTFVMAVNGTSDWSNFIIPAGGASTNGNVGANVFGILSPALASGATNANFVARPYFFFHFWSNNATGPDVSVVKLWYAVGSNDANSGASYKYLTINLQGSTTYSIRCYNAGATAVGGHFVFEDTDYTDGANTVTCDYISTGTSGTNPFTLLGVGSIVDQTLNLCGYSQANDFNYLYRLALTIKQEL